MTRIRRAISATVVLLTAALVTSCATSDDSTSSPPPQTVIVDTDGGSDDAMALLYLLQDPSVHVAAITVSGTGLVHCPVGASNVSGLIELAAPDVPTPVACGPDAPTQGVRAFPEEWRSQADGRYGGILPAGEAPTGGADAVDLLVETIESSSPSVTVLTLGPLTNLALALEQAPDAVEHIDRVVVMGGAFGVPGNVHLDSEPGASIAEWNMYVDPAAMQRVLDSGVSVTFVPLDTQVPVDPYVVRDLVRAASSPPAKVVADLLSSSPFFVSGEFFFWDPLAAAAVAEPSLFSSQRAQLAIVTEGSGAGWTTVGRGAKAQIASVVDADRFIGTYIATLDGLPGPVAVSRTPDAEITASPGCSVTPSTVRDGSLVLSLVSPTAAAAIGTIEPGRTDAEIEAFVATSPTGSPPWFSVSVLLQTDGAAREMLADLTPGSLTIVCIEPSGTGPTVSGRATLTVTGVD